MYFVSIDKWSDKIYVEKSLITYVHLSTKITVKNRSTTLTLLACKKLVHIRYAEWSAHDGAAARGLRRGQWPLTARHPLVPAD